MRELGPGFYVLGLSFLVAFLRVREGGAMQLVRRWLPGEVLAVHGATVKGVIRTRKGLVSPAQTLVCCLPFQFCSHY